MLPSPGPGIRRSRRLALLASCASTDYHYSQLYGQRYNRAPIDTYDVSVVRCPAGSGRAGVRKISQGPPGGASRLGEQREIALDVRPCTRYYLSP